MTRAFAAALVLGTAILAGCVTTPPTTIRPGLTAEQVARPLPKPGGLTYRWRVTRSDEAEFEAGMRMRSTRIAGGLTRYNGALFVELPPEFPLPDNFNQVSREISQQIFGTPDAGIRLRNGNLEIPASFTMTPDSKFTDFNLFGISARHVPHDCFAVVGPCSYVTVVDGRPQSRVRVTTTEEDGVWRATLRSREGGESRQVYSIDQNGVLLDAIEFSREDGRSVVTKFERQ